MSRKTKSGKGKNAPPPAEATTPTTTSAAVADPPAQPDLDLDEELSQQDFEDAEEEIGSTEVANWEMFAGNSRVSFFDLMQMIPESAWESELMVYLYRLHPPVTNQTGEKKYIGRFTHPIDEQIVKDTHGGGRYHVLLKRDRETLKQAKFSIEGEPILLPGQNIRTQPGAAAVAPGAGTGSQSDLASVVREVINAVKGDPGAANAGIRVMEKAMTDGIALNTRILEGQINSPTGNKVSDQIIAGLLPRLLAPPTQDPMVGQLLTAMLSMLTKERKAESNPAPAANPVDPMQQLTFVKDLLGVDSIKELFDQGGRAKTEPVWMTLLSSAIDRLPTLMHEFGEIQRQNFERALMAHQVRAGLPLTGTVIQQGPPVAIAATPAPGGTAEQHAQQMMQVIVAQICRAYDEGYSGDIAAAHLKLSHPDVVESLKPLLTDPVQVAGFVSSIPALAERSADPEWTEFQTELIAEMRQQVIPPGEETTEQELHAAAPAAPATTAPATPVPAKRKTNGRAA